MAKQPEFHSNESIPHILFEVLEEEEKNLMSAPKSIQASSVTSPQLFEIVPFLPQVNNKKIKKK